MSDLDFTGFRERKALSEILTVPKTVQSVYSLTQHVWAGDSDEARRESKKRNAVRLETLSEFLVDPVRDRLHSVLEKVAEGEGQGFWFQADFGVGKSHLLASTAILAVGGAPAWERLKDREDADKAAGPGRRLDTLWRKKVEGRKVFPIVFSLEGCGGTEGRTLVDFVLSEAQDTFALRQGRPLAVYREEHLARLFLKEHQAVFRDPLRTFLADERLMRGLPAYQYDELIAALKNPDGQRDAGRVLLAFYRHQKLDPQVPTEPGERLERAVRDILESGYQGVLVVIDEMSEYLRRTPQANAADEDCLLLLSNTLPHTRGLPVWTLVAAQMAHNNPKKIIAPDRLRLEPLEHKAQRFRDIVVQRTRTVTDGAAVKVYFDGYRTLVPWVKETVQEDFEAAFPFPPEAIDILRRISAKLTGTRSTIGFLHRALQRAVEDRAKDLVPLWRVFEDLMSYNETPSTASSGGVSIPSQFPEAVAALRSAQGILAHITDGHLSRPQNRQRAERILNTLFLYHIAGLTDALRTDQILNAVCDLKPQDDQLEAQLGHYETILEEMRSRLRNQIRGRDGRYEFVAKATGQYDDLAHEAAEKLRQSPQVLWTWIDRAMTFTDREASSPFADYVPADGRLLPLKVTWHGQDRTGRVTAADLGQGQQPEEVDTHGNEDDFVIVLAKRPATEKAVDAYYDRGARKDPRLVVWAPAEPTDAEKATLAGVLAHLVVADEQKETGFGKDGRREFLKSASRAFGVLREMYGRGLAKTPRTSLAIPATGGVEGALQEFAGKAMDTCYRSRSIDFGNRKFDMQGAVKLINGLVRRGRAVSEADQLWSAVENFAVPLALVRPASPTLLDTSTSTFCQEIRDYVEAKCKAGLDIKTVYNRFTGYDPGDGTESPGLTRRMVDVYLLCLAQQGVLRVNDRKGGPWIDRATIAGVEFKPETLRNLGRIELPRALDGWQAFHGYVEVLTEKAPGTLGPKYDKATADDALATLSSGMWIRNEEIERINVQVGGLFSALGADRTNPFDDLLLYWLQFVEIEWPTGDELRVFDALKQAVLHVANIEAIDGLTPGHLDTFRDNYRRLRELRNASDKTAHVLMRAARFVQAGVPSARKYKDIAEARKALKAELDHADDLILDPDAMNARLDPALKAMVDRYVPAYLDALMELDAAQGDLDTAKKAAREGTDWKVLADFEEHVADAAKLVSSLSSLLDGLPARLRRSPEDRDRVRPDVDREAVVRDVRNKELTLQDLVEAAEARRTARKDLDDGPRKALLAFAQFLRSPGIRAGLTAAGASVAGVADLLAATSDEDVILALQTLPDAGRHELGKLLKSLLAGRKPKTIRLADFHPTVDTLWEEKEIDTVVDQFRDYLKGCWEDGAYVKVE